MSKRVSCSAAVSAASLAPRQILGVTAGTTPARGSDRTPPEWIRKIVRVRLSYWHFSETKLHFGFLHVLNAFFRPAYALTFQPFNDSTPQFFPWVFLAIRSMSAIGFICHLSLAPPAATRFPSSIIIAVIVLPHRGVFRRSPRNTCSK